jgi:two-component system chemotaxis sensor kinase CheA
MKRPVGILMDTEIMRIDAGDNIAKVGIQAMSREQSKLYDYLVVYKNKAYLGVVSIRLFLLELSKRNEAQISVLKNQQQKLISAHEKEVVLRKDLEYQSASVQNLLDHADQGFLWFGGDLTVKKEYSYKCLDIFHQSIGGVCYLEPRGQNILTRKRPHYSARPLTAISKTTTSVTDHVYLMLLPSDCVIGGKNIHFEYRPIESGGEKAVMAVLTDITEKVALERAMEEDRNKQRLIIKAFSCQGQIRRMIDEFFEIFSGGYKNFFQEGTDFGESLHELFRAVHTFKGDLPNTASFLPPTSSTVRGGAVFPFPSERGGRALDVEAIMAKANPAKMLENDLKVIQEVLGGSYLEQSETVSVPKSSWPKSKRRCETGRARSTGWRRRA